MSRSGYTEDYDWDHWAMIRWRGAVTSALRGKKGQAFLRELRDALDALPAPRLIQGQLQSPEGDVCALGAVARCRNLDTAGVDPEDNTEGVGRLFGIPRALAAEIEFINDDDFGYRAETPEQCFARVRRWVEANIRTPTEVK